MKKLISLDIDGTLYNSQRQITPATRAALLRAQEKGPFSLVPKYL